MPPYPPSRVRGIYATAITALLLEEHVPIADPSRVMISRFELSGAVEHPRIGISDRADRQGIVIEGERDDLARLLELFKQRLPRAVVRPERRRDPACSLEFPASIKQEMDEIRRRVMPTIYLHHRLKTINSDKVDEAERELERAPERLDEISARLRKTLIDRHFTDGVRVAVEHVKPAGQMYDLGGRLASFDGRNVHLTRRFSPGGFYDSLDVPKLRGDYGVLDLEEGCGISVRRYYREDGRLLGDLYNLATEAELYPARVRYVDLELDVLHMPGEAPRVVDEIDLQRAHDRGFLSNALVEDAWELAEQVVSEIEHNSAQ